MVWLGGINVITREVPMPVSHLAVHALSSTLLCLSGINVTSMLIVKEFHFELYLLVTAGRALPSSFQRYISSAVHPVLSFLAQLRLRQSPHLMMALPQTVHHPRMQTLLQVQKIPPTT